MATNGSCGSSNNQTLSSAPTGNLCSTGSATSVSGVGPWYWNCNGANGGGNASCSAKKAVVTNGSCGSSNNQTLSSAPTGNFCTSGSATSVTGSGPWYWNCNGLNGGSSVTCTAKKNSIVIAAPTIGTLGVSPASAVEGSTFRFTAPVTGSLTNRQVYVQISRTDNGQFDPNDSNLNQLASCSNNVCIKDWKLNASGKRNVRMIVKEGSSQIATGATNQVTVTAKAVVTNGSCGSSNNQTLSSAPTGNFCASGSATSVTGSGPWYWNCNGLNGGSSVTCTAKKNSIVISAPTIGTLGVSPASAVEGSTFRFTAPVTGSLTNRQVYVQISRTDNGQFDPNDSNLNQLASCSNGVCIKDWKLNASGKRNVRMMVKEGSNQIATGATNQVTVTAKTVVINGSCGSSNNQTLSSAPTGNLCASGSTTSVTGSGPWYWNCKGTNGGSSASCSAQKTAVSDTTKPSVTFSINASSITLGASVIINYTVADIGTGLKQVELWRSTDNKNWAEITGQRKMLSGNGPIQGTFTDNTLTKVGTYYYGITPVDNSNNKGVSGSKSVTVKASNNTTDNKIYTDIAYQQIASGILDQIEKELANKAVKELRNFSLHLFDYYNSLKRGSVGSNSYKIWQEMRSSSMKESYRLNNIADEIERTGKFFKGQALANSFINNYVFSAVMALYDAQGSQLEKKKLVNEYPLLTLDTNLITAENFSNYLLIGTAGVATDAMLILSGVAKANIISAVIMGVSVPNVGGYDVFDPMPSGDDNRVRWINIMKQYDKALNAKYPADGKGLPGGFLQYLKLKYNIVNGLAVRAGTKQITPPAFVQYLNPVWDKANFTWNIIDTRK